MKNNFKKNKGGSKRENAHLDKGQQV